MLQGMRFLRVAAVATALLALAGVARAEPRVYCFATAIGESDKLLRVFTQPMLYVTPVFESDDPLELLEVMYRESIPDAGLATCVGEEDAPDIDASWQQLIDGSKAQGAPVTVVPLPLE